MPRPDGSRVHGATPVMSAALGEITATCSPRADPAAEVPRACAAAELKDSDYDMAASVAPSTLFLEKPITAQQLLSRVRQALDQERR